MIKLSIIIPVYNSAQYLCECLDSILNQKNNDYEVIAVNDGSFDNSAEILRDYSKKFKQLKVITQKNSGPNVARNNGLACSVGKFVWFIDSDDYIANDSINKLINYIELYNPDLLRFSYKTVNSNSKNICPKINGSIKKVSVDSAKINLLTTNKYNSLWGEIIKKEFLIKRINWDKSLQGEDLLINLSVYDKIKVFFYLDDEIYFYRVDSNGTTNSFSYDKIKRCIFDMVNVHNKKIEYSKKWDVNFKDLESVIDLDLVNFISEKLKVLSNTGLNKKSIFSLLDDIYSNDELISILNRTKKICGNNFILNWYKNGIINKNKFVIYYFLIIYKMFFFIKKVLLWRRIHD